MSSTEQDACRYQLDHATALQTSKQILAKLEALTINANPIHFTLFYEIAHRINPTLSDEIGHALAHNEYDDESAKAFFHKLMLEVMDKTFNSEEFSDIINELVVFIESWIDGSQKTHNELNHVVAELNSLKTNEDIVQQLQDKILPTIRNYQLETTELHGQIKDSSSEIKRLKMELDKATSIAKIDELTQIPNRRGFNEIMDNVMTNANTEQSSFAMLLIDIDHFKKINDVYGHLVGDSILRYLAKSLQNEIKGQDYVARIGGEEFVVILPNTPYSASISVADGIRKKVAARPLHVKGQENPIKLTISIGVDMYQLGESADELFERADKNLYQAKCDGRNRVCGESY